MKKSIFKIGLYLAIGGTTIVSCNRLLETEDPSRVSESGVTSTLSGFDMVNRGFYTGGQTVINWYANSLITDELVINVDGNLGGGRQYYTGDYGPGTTEDRDNNMGLFRGYYTIVRRANLTINNIDKIATISASDEVTKNKLKAEAYAARAYAHFMVLQLFSPKYSADALGCAYVTVVDDFALPSRDNMKTSYEKVLADLNEAEKFFAIGSDNDNTRMNKGAVQALKAKVYLEIGDYSNAITYANNVLAAYDLTTASNYPNVWADSNDYQEVILKQANLDSSGSNSGTLFVNSGDAVQYNASATLYNKFEDGDVRKNLFMEYQSKGVIPLKYLKPSFDGVKTIRGRADVKLIRTAEILLLRSEAYARSNDLTNAFADYKKLRDARTAGTSVAFTSQADALDKILLERDRELCYEGFRLLDIKRFGKTIVRVAEDSRPNFTTLTFTNVNKFTLPIPQAEVFANPNMQQNIGY